MNKQLEETACLYVLDQLDSHERAAFETRLVRDPELDAFVRELEPALARGVRALPQREPPAGALDRIEARIDALRESAEAAHEPRRERTRGHAARGSVLALDWFSLARWGVAAVIALSLATLAIQSLRNPAGAAPVVVFVGLDPNQNTFAELPMQAPAKDADARFVQLASLAENFWRKPGDMPVRVAPAAGDSRAYALFDTGSKQGFIVVEQLPALAAAERYHLWVVDSRTGRTQDAGALPANGSERSLYSFAIGSDDSLDLERPDFFITVEENEAQSGQPSGKVVLGRGKI